MGQKLWKGAEPPSTIFGPFLLWPNGWMHQAATWYGARPQPRGLFVRWGPSLPSQKGGRALGRSPPQFLAHVYCGQTAGCITMPLGMDLGLSPRDFVLGEDPASPPLKGHSPPIFGQCPLWPNDWMDEDAICYGSRRRPRPHCVRWAPSSPPPKGHSSPRQILAHVYCGQTA